jgi:AmmeMemoRadiSam system protein B
VEVRQPAAPYFYSGDCVRSVRHFLTGFNPPALPEQVIAGVVPHAGWQYSGAVAAKVYESIRRKSIPLTFVIFGAVHRRMDPKHAVYATGAWETPLGDAVVDEELAAAILEQTPEWAAENSQAHEEEHAIEVQLPFIRHLFPSTKIVPISVNPTEQAVPFGRRVGELLREQRRDAVVIGSTDLTHYGEPYCFTPAGFGARAHEWLRANDARILRLAEQMQAEELVPEAARHQNACGPGALAATVAAARTLGAERGYLLDYTTSYDVAPEPVFRMAVGYAGLLF